MTDASEARMRLARDLTDENSEQNQNGGPASRIAATSMMFDPVYSSGGAKSLSGISIRGFGLGIALGISSLLSAQLAYSGSVIWREFLFISTLSVFHYLEFDMTARYNPADATTDSFLLFSNGMAYTAAHGTAMFEVIIRHWLQSDYKPDWLVLPFDTSIPVLPTFVQVIIGIVLILSGQLVRSVAMKEAGQNFNHVVQWRKKEDHTLVTKGVYAFSRHPAYFGFYWWALGTQFMLGNCLSLFAYAIVLWKFFSSRIRNEERYLISFFGQAYLDYRAETPILIPFIKGYPQSPP